EEARPEPIEDGAIVRAHADAERDLARRELGREIFLDRNRRLQTEIEGEIRDPKSAGAQDLVDAKPPVEDGPRRQRFAMSHRAYLSFEAVLLHPGNIVRQPRHAPVNSQSSVITHMRRFQELVSPS